MHTTAVTDINFSAKNPRIRFADDLAREVNKQFPTFSLSRTKYWRNSKKVQNFLTDESKSWNTYKEALQTYGEIVCSKKKNYTKFNLLMDAIEKYRMANCFERSLLALVMAKCAGLKKCSIRIMKYGILDLDHAVLYVADGKKPYIIDPWLGFADFVPKAIERYNGELRRFLKYFPGYNKHLRFASAKNALEFPCPSLLSNKALTPLSILKFANTRPELFIKYKH
ncbi:hypothetical protein J6S88_07685 [bacterium]|nr:hypothetical protein [bacterium]